MKKFLLLTALLTGSFFALAQLKGLKEKVLGGIDPVSTVFKKPPPITTSFDDVNMSGYLPETFGNERTYTPLCKMKPAEGGGFLLGPGYYEMTNMSYCLKAGTHGPSQGDGYMFAFTKGKMEDIVNALLINHATKHPEIVQHDVQVILWAIIARAKFENLSNKLKSVVTLLLTPKQIVELNGGFVETFSGAALRKGFVDIPPAAQKIMEAENNIRGLVDKGGDNYADFERLAVIGGMAPNDRPDIHRGMWSLHPDGYYIRYLPSGYSKTHVQIYVPESISQVIYNAVGTIACPANTGAQRLAQTNIPIDDKGHTLPNPCFPKPSEDLGGGNNNQPPDSSQRLYGYVDMHTHPMSYLGFGRKAMHGLPDIGSLVPAGTRNCNPVPYRAKTLDDALGNCNATHGGWGVDNTCGDYIRAGIINYAMDDKFVYKTSNIHGDHEHAGYPDFAFWPNQTSILHQQMWWEWIKRAYDGGLRVMVTLAVNNELLGEVLSGDLPYDDRSVADVQIDETISFVQRHSDFMEIAYSAADLRRIIGNNKLAIILGIEVDKLGNFGKTGVLTNEMAVRAEIQRLYRKGIRYAFPIHLIDNSFGGTAVSDPLFNFANRRANGYHFRVTTSSDPVITYRADLLDGPQGFENRLIMGLKAFLEKLAELPMPCFNDLIKCSPPPGKLKCCSSFEKIVSVFNPSPEFDIYKLIPGGHVNALGLTQLGSVAINEMMKQGMMIDIDHMSEFSMIKAIDIAKGVNGGYPLLMGHNGIRISTPDKPGSERNAPPYIVEMINSLGGMFGVGTADLTAEEFINNYKSVRASMKNGAMAIGTDADGFEPLPKYTGASDEYTSQQFYANFFNESSIKTKCGITGSSRKWDYITEKGMAQYGLMPEFLYDVKTTSEGAEVVDSLMRSAEYFARMWLKCETVSKIVSSVPVAGTYTYNINPVTGLCPNQLIAGDREFGGHGPRVIGAVKLKISPDGARLQAVIDFDAKETVSNWSEVRGSWTVDIGDPAPAGMRYTSINGQLSSYFDEVLTGGGGNELFDGCDGADHLIVPSNGPVSMIFVVGDTSGDDISTDNDCTCDTRIRRIEFKPLTVTISKR